MASIGGVTCTMVKGVGQLDAPRDEVWETPGIAGIGARKIGDGGSGFAYTAIKFGAIADLIIWGEAINAMKTSVITIIDDMSVTRTNCYLRTVTPVSAKARVNYDGNGAYRGELQVSGTLV